MAKVPFSKLKAKINSENIKVCYCNSADEETFFEVRKYLPFSEKLELVSDIINQSIDDNGYYNPMKVKFYMVIEMVYAYTNLTFTDKMKEDPFKLYDIFISDGIFSTILNVIGEEEKAEIENSIWTTIDNIYKYNNSVMGILDTVKRDYDNLNFDAMGLKNAIGDPENLKLLKDVLTKLG